MTPGRQSRSDDDGLTRAIEAALHRRTQHVTGAADSLSKLRRDLTSSPARPISQPRAARRRPVVAGLAAVLTVAAIIATVALIRLPLSDPGTPGQPTTHGAGYLPEQYYPATDVFGRPVIVRGNDNTVVRQLPPDTLADIGEASNLVLSPDGKRLYGSFTDRGNANPLPAGSPLPQMAFVDLKTNILKKIASPAGRVVSVSVSADGKYFGYAVTGTAAAGRTTIHIVSVAAGTDRATVLPAGQQVSSMALSPDGGDLALTLASDTAAVTLLRPADGATATAQRRLTQSDCPGPDSLYPDVPTRYADVQWTARGLYAVRTCQSDELDRVLAVVRFDPGSTEIPAVTVAAWRFDPFNALLVRETADGPVIYLDQAYADAPTRIRVQPPNGAPSSIVTGLHLRGSDHS